MTLRPFQQQQIDFTQWIRDKTTDAHGLDVDRLNVYRELVRNNLHSFLQHAFPIARNLLPAPVWYELFNRFSTEHASSDPFFYTIPKQFVDFVTQNMGDTWRNDYPWLADLLHFEWIEIFIHRFNSPTTRFPSGQPQIQLSMPIWTVNYYYPVNEWTLETKLTDIQKSDRPVNLLLWQPVHKYKMRAANISPLMAVICEPLIEQKVADFENIAKQVRTVLPAWTDAQIDNALAQTFAQLAKLDAGLYNQLAKMTVASHIQ